MQRRWRLQQRRPVWIQWRRHLLLHQRWTSISYSALSWRSDRRQTHRPQLLLWRRLLLLLLLPLRPQLTVALQYLAIKRVLRHCQQVGGRTRSAGGSTRQLTSEQGWQLVIGTGVQGEHWVIVANASLMLASWLKAGLCFCGLTEWLLHVVVSRRIDDGSIQLTFATQLTDRSTQRSPGASRRSSELGGARVRRAIC